MDAAPLSELAEQTFRDTFAAVNTAADMDLHCRRFYAPEIQAREIDDPEQKTLVAEEAGVLLAYAQIRRGPVPEAVLFPSAIELRRLYVDQARHGSGLAKEMMDAVLELARGSGAAAVWLGVWEHNPRAIRFYRRCGYTEVGTMRFLLGSDEQLDLVMVVAVDAYGR